MVQPIRMASNARKRVRRLQWKHIRKRIVNDFLGTTGENEQTHRSPHLTSDERNELERRLNVHRQRLASKTQKPRTKNRTRRPLLRRLGQSHGSRLNRTPIDRLRGEQNDARIRQTADKKMYPKSLNTLPMALSNIVLHTHASKRKGHRVYTADFEEYPVLQFPAYFHAGSIVADARVPDAFRNVFIDRLIRERLLRESGQKAFKAHEIALQKEQLDLHKRGQLGAFMDFVKDRYPLMHREHARLQASEWAVIQFATRSHSLAEKAARKWLRTHPNNSVPKPEERIRLSREFHEHQQRTEQRMRKDPVLTQLRPILPPRKEPEKTPPRLRGTESQNALLEAIGSMHGRKEIKKR